MDEFGKEVQRFERFTVRCVFFQCVCVCVCVCFFRMFFVWRCWCYIPIPSIFRCWFKYFYNFTPTWGRFSIWLIFFSWVETTNQILLIFHTRMFFWFVFFVHLSFSLPGRTCGQSCTGVVFEYEREDMTGKIILAVLVLKGGPKKPVLNGVKQPIYTPNFNITPEKWWLEDEFPFGIAYF